MYRYIYNCSCFLMRNECCFSTDIEQKKNERKIQQTNAIAITRSFQHQVFGFFFSYDDMCSESKKSEDSCIRRWLERMKLILGKKFS